MTTSAALSELRVTLPPQMQQARDNEEKELAPHSHTTYLATNVYVSPCNQERLHDLVISPGSCPKEGRPTTLH